MFEETKSRSIIVVVPLLFAAVLLASVSNARANSITYTITPITEPDWVVVNAETLTGSITFSASAGSVLGTYSDWSALPAVTASISITSPLGSFYASGTQVVLQTTGYDTDPYLTLTSTACSISGATLWFQSDSINGDPYDGYVMLGEVLSGYQGLDWSFNAAWFVGPSDGGISVLNAKPKDFTIISTAAEPPPTTFATAQTVPEPASLTLLLSALLGLAGAFYLRRRRAKA
jgi:hypothetical protein